MNLNPTPIAGLWEVETMPQRDVRGSLTRLFCAEAFAVAVPEPETWALMLAGLAGLGVLKRRRAVRA